MQSTKHIFHYKSPFLLNALRENRHKSRRQGADGDFYKRSLFWSEPNPARIDLASSVKDPFESVYVKSFRQRSRLDVRCLIDGSDSMLFDNKVELATQCEQSISDSILAENDHYAAYVFTESVKAVEGQMTVPTAFKAVANHKPNTAQGLSESYKVLPKRSGLIFLISDFHWTASQFESRFRQLSKHYVIPIILWRSSEYSAYPLWRFMQINDSETGGTKLIFMTPKQKQWIESAYISRREYLNAQFRRFNHRPFWLIDAYQPQQMSAYFYGG